MNNKPMITSIHDVVCDEGYTEWLSELKQSYRTAQITATVRMNVERLKWNWNMGRDLVMRKAEERWGSGIVEQVSLDLQAEFPNERGFSADSLWAMKRWYLFYAKSMTSEKLEKLSQELYLLDNKEDEKLENYSQESGNMPFPSLFALIPWWHHVTIVRNCKNVDEALFYIHQTIDNGWNGTVLQRNIKDNLYEKQGGAITNFAQRLPKVQAKLAQEITKENYDFNFVSLPNDYNEHDLEAELEKHISRFLLELGNGFAFVGRQKELIVDGVSRRIDMLFYHIRLHCYVVVELKAVRFEPEYAGKLNFYVNAVDDILRGRNDNPTIGLLICSDMRDTEVRYSFKGIDSPIGVATYDNVQIKELERELPSIEELQQKIKQLEDILKV